MSTKIQILNEKQVDHYYDVLLPKLMIKFNAKAEELKELAKKEVNRFIVHEDVLKLKEEHNKIVEKAKFTIKLQLDVKALDENYTLTSTAWRTRLITTQEGLDELQNAQVKEIDELILSLAEQSVKVNHIYTRTEEMKNELRARLAMTAVADFEVIQNKILSEIKIDNFFTNTITQ